MNRALQIPELLGFIFGYLDITSRLSCALVCKHWSHIALDVLWKDLDSPKPLLRLLGHLTPKSNDEQWRFLEFARPIRVENWDVFDRYARRVRMLNLEFIGTDLSSDVFFELAQKRHSLTLLPNVNRLQIEPEKPEDLVHALLFMSSSVTELSFCCPAPLRDFSADNISEFFNECVIRMPNLKKFEFCTVSDDLSVTEMKKHLATFLSSLQDLNTFSCPLYFASSSVVTSLSQLPALRIITLDYPNKLGCGQPADVMAFRPSVSPGSFAALVDLSFSAIFEDASSFLDMDCAPNLTLLWIHSPTVETAESLHQLLVLLSKRRPQLKELCIDSVSTAIHKPLRNEEGSETDRVTLQSLLPLLDLPNIRRFEATYHRAFQLSDADIEKLLSNWQSLEHLHFCCDPLLKETPTLTPDVLPIIARSCPKLHTLSLYLDTRVTYPSLPTSDPVHPIRFIHLQDINFGVSPLTEEDIPSFSLYLSDLLPPTCEVDSLCGSGWLNYDELSQSGFGNTLEDVQRWGKVTWALKMLVKAREQERCRVRDLEKEARDLAMRIAMLEEQRRLGLSDVMAADSGKVCVHQ